MIEFKVTAPGKVILFGEHSVVYGKSAIAGSIDLKTTLYFKELPPEEKNIHICLPDTGLNTIIPIEKIEETFFSGEQLIFNNYSENLFGLVEQFTDKIGYKNTSQKLSLEAVIFLVVAIYRSQGLINIKSFKIHAETQLSIGSGLGSSASFAVCLAACILHYTNILLNKVSTLSYDCLKKVSNYAFDCEKIMHGSPSGIDNAICTYGSLLHFKKNDVLVKFPCCKTLRIILVDTKVQRSTKTLVQIVKDKKEKFPDIINPILEAMDQIAEEGLKIIKCMIQSLKSTEETDEDFKKLGTLMEINHNLLCALGVSHPTLDTIYLEAKSCGFAAKLTGAGGGGYAYIIIPFNIPEEKIHNLTKKLIIRGFGVKLTTIGGSGVTILE